MHVLSPLLACTSARPGARFGCNQSIAPRSTSSPQHTTGKVSSPGDPHTPKLDGVAVKHLPRSLTTRNQLNYLLSLTGCKGLKSCQCPGKSKEKLAVLCSRGISTHALALHRSRRSPGFTDTTEPKQSQRKPPGTAASLPLSVKGSSSLDMSLCSCKRLEHTPVLGLGRKVEGRSHSSAKSEQEMGRNICGSPQN